MVEMSQPIVADDVHHFMAAIHHLLMAAPSMIMHRVTNWFHEHNNELTALQWPHQSPDLNQAEDLWDVALILWNH